MFLCSLIALRACTFFLFKLHERDPRIPKWYGQHIIDYDLVPISGNLHATSGIIFILTILFQIFSARKKRFKKLHRTIGKLALINSLILSISGIYIGLLIPFGGIAESLISSTFGIVFLFYNYKLYKSAKERNFELHLNYVIRVIFLALSIGTLRIGISLFTSTTGMNTQILFNLIMSTSLILHLVLCELMIYFKIYKNWITNE